MHTSHSARRSSARPLGLALLAVALAAPLPGRAAGQLPPASPPGTLARPNIRLVAEDWTVHKNGPGVEVKWKEGKEGVEIHFSNSTYAFVNLVSRANLYGDFDLKAMPRFHQVGYADTGFIGYAIGLGHQNDFPQHGFTVSRQLNQRAGVPVPDDTVNVGIFDGGKYKTVQSTPGRLNYLPAPWDAAFSRRGGKLSGYSWATINLNEPKTPFTIEKATNEPLAILISVMNGAPDRAGFPQAQADLSYLNIKWPSAPGG